MPNADGSPTINEIISMAGSLSAIEANNLKTEQAKQAIDLQKQKDAALSALNAGVDVNAPIVSRADYSALTEGMSPEQKQALNSGQTFAQALKLSPSAVSWAIQTRLQDTDALQKQQAISDEELFRIKGAELAAQYKDSGTITRPDGVTDYQFDMMQQNAAKFLKQDAEVQSQISQARTAKAKMLVDEYVKSRDTAGYLIKTGKPEAARQVMADFIKYHPAAMSVDKDGNVMVDDPYNNNPPYPIGNMSDPAEFYKEFSKYTPEQMYSLTTAAEITRAEANDNAPIENFYDKGGQKYMVRTLSDPNNAFIKHKRVYDSAGKLLMDFDNTDTEESKKFQGLNLTPEEAYLKSIKATADAQGKVADLTKTKAEAALLGSKIGLVGAQTNQAITAAGLNNAKIQTERDKPARDADKSEKRAIKVDETISKLKLEKIKALKENPDRAKYIQDNISRLASELKELSPKRYHRQFGKNKDDDSGKNKFDGLY